MKKFILLQILLLSILMGLTGERTKAENLESGKSDIPFQTVQYSSGQMEDTLELQYQIRGNNVYVECIIPNFSFTKSGGPKKDGEGHIHVFIDGEMADQINTAAFILKDLPKGKHHIRVKIVHNDYSSYKLSKSIHVVIK